MILVLVFIGLICKHGGLISDRLVHSITKLRCDLLIFFCCFCRLSYFYDCNIYNFTTLLACWIALLLLRSVPLGCVTPMRTPWAAAIPRASSPSSWATRVQEWSRVSARESPTSSQVIKSVSATADEHTLSERWSVFFFSERRHCHPFVRAAVWGMQVLQKPQDQPLPEDQVSAVWLI